MMRLFALIVAFACALPTLGMAQRADTANGAVLRWLDRTTGQLADVEIQSGQLVTLGPLRVQIGECRYPSGAISRDAFALLQVTDLQAGQDIFSGWMVASSPALNSLEHRRYDIWVLRCKTF